MSSQGSPPPPAESRFRSTLVRVLVVQVVALTLLALVQLVYHVG